MNDITAEDYDAITDIAYDLHNQVHHLMGRVGPAGHNPAWDELHELMQLVSVLSGAARRYADRARLPREPVTYQPVDEDLNPAERDEAAFWAKRAIR